MVLDSLKDAWRNQQEATINFTETDIYKMIHKKSTSIVKWILYISIIEFIVFVIPNFFIDNKESTEKLNLTNFSNITIAILVLVTLYFIFLFYRNYKNISVNDSTKKLMQDILKTKKTVTYYIVFQLSMLSITIFVTAYKVITTFEKIKESFSGSDVLIWIAIIVITIVMVLIFWLFYKLIYGILLKRLKQNFKELKRSES